MGSRQNENKFQLMIETVGDEYDIINRDNLVAAAALCTATEALNGSTWPAALQTDVTALAAALTAVVSELDTPT